jgi:hypothetical protein
MELCFPTPSIHSINAKKRFMFLYVYVCCPGRSCTRTVSCCGIRVEAELTPELRFPPGRYKQSPPHYQRKSRNFAQRLYFIVYCKRSDIDWCSNTKQSCRSFRKFIQLSLPNIMPIDSFCGQLHLAEALNEKIESFA